MKSLSLILTVLFTINTIVSFAQDSFFQSVDDFLKNYVADGEVNYAAIKENPASLNELVKKIKSFSPSEDATDRNLAYYINSYNILVIKQVVDKHPIDSPMDIPGFFDNTTFSVAGKNLTLNQIENEIVRPTFQDPRIHFVLVCGAVDCPPLTNFAYNPDEVDKQLDAQTKKALNDEKFIRVDETSVQYSEIFKWYEQDFLTEYQSVKDFINSYRSNPIGENLSTGYYDYDWSLNDKKKVEAVDNSTDSQDVSNIFTYTPSKLLKQGQFEVQLFNNLYTQTAYRDDNREKIELDGRSTYYTGLLYVLYGISKNSRINIGFDLNIRSVLNDTSGKGPFNVFRFENTPYSRTAISTIGPKIKIQPFKNTANFSIQSAFWFPVADDLEGQKEENKNRWLDYHMYTWWNQFFYDKTFGSKWQIFTEADLLFRFKTSQSNTPTQLDVPVSFFLSWFPLNRATLYYQIQYSPRFQLEKTESDDGMDTVNPFTYLSDYAQTGIGAKYQVTRNLNLEASATYFFTSRNGGAGSTYNLGIRIII